MLPFGSIVAAHRPLETQTALGGRAQETAFVGIAPKFATGIMLFNPVTKRTYIYATPLNICQMLNLLALPT